MCGRCADRTEQGWARSYCMTLVMCFWRLQSCASIPAMRWAQVCSLAYSSSRGYFFVSSSSPSGLSGASGRKCPSCLGNSPCLYESFYIFLWHNITKPHAFSPILNKQDAMFHGDLVVALRLKMFVFLRITTCIFQPLPKYSPAEGKWHC